MKVDVPEVDGVRTEEIYAVAVRGGESAAESLAHFKKHLICKIILIEVVCSCGRQWLLLPAKSATAKAADARADQGQQE